MITIDLVDELEMKTVKPMTPKRRKIESIWWGIWKSNNKKTQSRLQQFFDVANISCLDEINIGNWRVR